MTKRKNLKSEKKKVKLNKLRGLTTAIALSTVLVGCAKDLPEKEPDSFETDVRALNSVSAAEIIVETVAVDTATLPMRAGVESQEEGQVSGVSALSASTFFKTKIVSSNDSKYNDFVKDLVINAKEAGQKFKITFKLTQEYLVGYIENAEQKEAGLNNRYLPSMASELTKVPLFQYSVGSYGIKENIKNDLDEETRNIRFKETNRTQASFFRINPIVENRTMTGLLGLDVEEAQEIYNRQNLEDTVWTVKRARSILNRSDVLTKSKQNGYNFKDTDVLRLAVSGNDKLTFFRPISKTQLTNVERKILQNNNTGYDILACDEDIAAAAKLPVDDCYLRAEFYQAISNVRFVYDRDQEDGSLLASVDIDTSNVDGETTPFIQISTDAKPTAKVTTAADIDGKTELKLSKFKNKEYMFRRVLEDAPNLYSMTFAGSSGGWNVEIVKFHFEEDKVLVKRSRPLLGKTGTTDVDEEIIMSFPATYKKEIKFSSTGKKLKVTRTEVASHTDPQASAYVDLSANGAPRMYSAIDAFYGERCFAGQVAGSKEANDVVQKADGVTDLLNYTIKNTYNSSPYQDCSGVYSWTEDAHKTLTFKERISFKRYYGTDENPILNIPYEVQKKFNYGIFTAEKSTPKGYTEQTNTFDTTTHMPMIFDIRDGKQVTYVLAGIPADKVNNKGIQTRELNEVERDLRNKLISSSKTVINQLNDGFKKAFVGTPYEGRSAVINLKIERDDSMPAGVKEFNGLEVVEKGHIGDINRNYIYWIEKGTSLSIIGLGGPTYNPRNGFVESASVYLYGGNMKGSIDWMEKQAIAEKRLVKDMTVPKTWQVQEDAAPQVANTAPQGEVEIETETTTTPVGSASKEEAAAKSLVAEIENHKSSKSRILSLLNGKDIPLKDFVNVSNSSFMRGVNKVRKISKEGYGVKKPLNNELFQHFGNEESAGKALSMTKAFKHLNNPVELAKALHGDHSHEAQRAELINKLEWSGADKRSGSTKTPLCVHRKADFVLSQLQQNYDILEKVKTAKGKNDIMIDIWMPTLAHEIGHNFGLRHNFIGSFDKKNWRFKVNDDNAKRTSSSVMDYTIDDHATYDGLGPYDVHAIRAAYTGFVELEGLFDSKADTMSLPGGTLKVTNAEETVNGKKVYRRLARIKDIMKLTGVENWSNVSREDLAKFNLQKIKFCSDEDAGQSPQCNRHDSGSTFKEIVDHEIMGYRKMYDLHYFAKDKKNFTIRDYSNYLVRVFSKLRMINEELWFKLIFENDGSDEFQETLQDMIGAIQKSMDFFRSVISTPEAPAFVTTKNPGDRFLPAVITETVPGPIPGMPGTQVKKMVKVETKWMEGETFDPQDFRAKVQGMEGDKVAAIIAMTAERSWTRRYLSHSLKIPYTLVEKFIFRKEIEDSVILQTLEEVLMNEIQPRVLVGDTLHDLDKGAFTSGVNEYLRNYAVFGAMYFLNIDTYEPGFNPSRSFRVKGLNANETAEGQPFVDLVDGGIRYVPYASDSSAANRMISKGNALRALVKSTLPDVMEGWATYLEQIPGFLDSVPAAPEYDAELITKTVEEIATAVEAGEFQAIVNGHAVLIGQYKNKLADTTATEEERSEAAAKLNEISDTIVNKLVQKDFGDAVGSFGLAQLSISDVDSFIRESIVKTILAKEACISDKSLCTADERSYLQGLKASHQDEFLRNITKKELEKLANAEYVRDADGNVLGIDLFSPIVSMALSNLDLSLVLPREAGVNETAQQTAALDANYKAILEQYRPAQSAGDIYDRVKGNMKELSGIFYWLYPQENR